MEESVPHHIESFSRDALYCPVGCWSVQIPIGRASFYAETRELVKMENTTARFLLSRLFSTIMLMLFVSFKGGITRNQNPKIIVKMEGTGRPGRRPRLRNLRSAPKSMADEWRPR